MRLDLRLLPCEHWNEQDGRLWGFTRAILNLGGICEEAWEAFQKMVRPHLAKLPADHSITSFVGALVSDGYHKGERVYGEFRDKDAYGTPYEFVAAEYLLPWIVDHFTYDGHLGHGPYQAAIAAYVRALPPATKIVLDWC